jgi:hypothetical protein
MKLTSTASLVLLYLRDTKPSLTISDLAMATGKQPSSMLQLLCKMVNAGLICRHHVARVSHYTLPSQTSNPGEATSPAPTALSTINTAA